MEKLIIYKKNHIPKAQGNRVRISKDMNEMLDDLSEEIGLSKGKVLDIILREVLPNIEVK